MTVLEKVAEVLDVPIAELAAEAPIVASVAEGEAPGASRLRLVLSSAHSLRAAELLDGLVPRLESATRAGSDEERPELFRLLAAMYHTCGAALANMGEPEVAWVAVDRAVVAAERAGDPLLMAAGAFRLSIVFLGARHRVRELLPEMFRAKPTIKQLVGDLVTMSPLPSDQLRALSRELGVGEE
ncbi:hypothetical protein [Streptomyces hainanensis]|uniref:hypothetical protein n=1 Tax=Streptomyces hainanensis TaxID=402648 RepID=UPI001FB63549|nr:hypothetical protein [Streptomyces hainanensis]